MAKSTRTTRTKRTKGASTRTKRSLPAPSGKPVIIVESPAKTRTLAETALQKIRRMLGVNAP